MVKAKFGGYPLEIWFTPSFNIKTTDKRIEQLIRSLEMEAYDPWEMRTRKVKATRSLRDAYLLLDACKTYVPELEVEIKQAPKLPTVEREGKDIVY